MGHFSTLALQVYQDGPDPAAVQPVSQSAGQSIWDHMGAALHASVYRVLSFFTSLLPGLLALVLAIAVMTAVGALVSYLLRRILTAVKFDDRMARNRAIDISSSIQDWAPSHSPTVLIARTGFWLCVLLGFVIGISAFDVSYSSTTPNSTQMSSFLLPYLTHAAGAVVLLIAGNVIARFLARSVLIGAVNAKLTYARFLSLGVKWMVLVLTAAMVLDHLGIGGTIIELAFGILFGGIVLTLSLAVGLGSKEIVSRSLERTADRMPPHIPEKPANTAETLRHF